MRQNSDFMSQAAVLHRILREKDIANPIATILSAAMMLRFTFDLDREADAIEEAVQQCIEETVTAPDRYYVRGKYTDQYPRDG